VQERIPPKLLAKFIFTVQIFFDFMSLIDDFLHFYTELPYFSSKRFKVFWMPRCMLSPNSTEDGNMGDASQPARISERVTS
jgi:hypothetical protein